MLHNRDTFTQLSYSSDGAWTVQALAHGWHPAPHHIFTAIRTNTTADVISQFDGVPTVKKK